jgi:hypothetical protein
MARKKSASIKTPVIAGVGLTIVILTPLLLLFAGIEVPIVGEVYANALGIDIVPQIPDGFEIPIPVITPSQTQQIQEIIDRIREISNEELDDAQFCLEFVGVEPEIITICNQLLQDALDRIEALDKEIDEILPPPDLNNTDSSIDPPPVQICDEIDCTDLPPIIPIPETSIIELSTSITKIDSNGNAELVEDVFDIPLASFFVEEETNIDYSTGRLEIKFAVKGDQTTTYIGTGKVDLLINNQSVLTAPLDVQVDGMGEVDLLFGGISDTFTLSIEDHFDKFVNEEVTPIVVQVKELNISDGTENFSMVDQDVFVMNILRDDFKILIVDEQGGGTERVYPTDSVLKVTGATTTVQAIRCNTYFISLYDCPACKVKDRIGDPLAPASPDSCIAGSIQIINFATDTARVIGLNLFDDSGNLLKSFAGGQGEVVNELLPRNTNYTLTIASPTLSVDLSFPKSQQTQSYTCTNEYSITYRKIHNDQISNVPNSSAGGYHVDYIEPVSFVVSKVNCNFP